MLSQYIIIGLGGGIGAIARVAISKLLPISLFGVPCQILFVNILGCFIIGLLTELLDCKCLLSDNSRSFLVPGLLGGFTTFSSFILEFGLLIEKHQTTMAVIYLIASCSISILFFYAGLKIIRLFS